MAHFAGRVVRVAGWLLLAYLAGILVAALISNGWLGLVVGSGGLLVAVVSMQKMGDRRPAFSERLIWTALMMIVLALLLAANRNTTMGSAPGRTWAALLLPGAAVILTFVGLPRRHVPGTRRYWFVAMLSALVLTGIAIDSFAAYRSESVDVTNGEVRLSGTLLLPRQEGRFPLVAFIHGAGPSPGDTFRHLGDLLARRGVAALMWDKRGSGGSVGGSPRDGFDELSSDVVAWVEAMGKRDDIDRTRIGLWGLSEGAWIAATAAETLDGVTAMVLESPGVGFGETVYYEHSWRLRNAGLSEADIERAVQLRNQINHYYRTAADRADILAELEAAQDEAWYEAAIEVGLLPRPAGVTYPDDPETVAFMDLQDFTLLTALSNYQGPVLASFGLQDQCNPAEESAGIIEDTLTGQGNDHVILVYPDASHAIVRWLAGASCGTANVPPAWYPAGYVDETTAWVTNHLRP